MQRKKCPPQQCKSSSTTWEGRTTRPSKPFDATLRAGQLESSSWAIFGAHMAFGSRFPFLPWIPGVHLLMIHNGFSLCVSGCHLRDSRGLPQGAAIQPIGFLYRVFE